MKNTQVSKHTLYSLIFSMACASGLASTAMADHKSHVPDYDFATRGVNYPGWPSEGACAADRPGQGCRLAVNSCEQYSHPIFTTSAIVSALQQALGEGQEIPIHLMSATGHFVNHLCTLGR